MYVSANPILQCRKDHVPLENKSKKTRGRQTHAREVKGPSLSIANHLLDLMFKLVGHLRLAGIVTRGREAWFKWRSRAQGRRVKFLLKTHSGYPRDAEVTLFTLANPGSSLRVNTHWSAPPVSALARSGGFRKMSQSPLSRNSNIERRMDRPKSVVGVIRGVA